MAFCKQFKSGLKLVVHKMEGIFSVSMGIMVGVGSVNENQLNNGISHFIEHVTFKGTPKRTSNQINEESEFLGSRINAYTSKEVTTYYIKSTTEKATDSFEILSDMFVNASYDQVELDKEKGVICEEIAMVEDTPDEVCLDLLSSAFFGNSGYGKTILGSKDNVNSFTRADVLNYRKAGYTLDNIVVVFCGNITESLAEKLVLDYLEGKLENKKSITQENNTIIYDKKYINKEIEQAHFAIAYNGVSFYDNNRYLLNLASTVLGGGMSSRLFSKIREEKGLCYTIYSYPSSYKDCGSFVIYSGVNPKTCKDAVASVLQEVKKFKQDGITEQEFLKAKNQYLASLIMSQESNVSLMSVFAKYLLLTGEVYDFDKAIKDIESITYKQIQSFIKDDLDLENFAFSLVSPNLDLSVL